MRLFGIESFEQQEEVARVVAENEGLSSKDKKKFLKIFKHTQRINTPEEEKNKTLRQETEYNSPPLTNKSNFIKEEEERLLKDFKIIKRNYPLLI